MIHTRTVLVTGATSRVGRLVVDELLQAGIRVRALTRQSPDEAALPAGADVVAGDFATPASLDQILQNVDSIFLIWTAPVATAKEVVERFAVHLAGRPGRLVYLSAPHQTPHPFFQQPNHLRALHIEVERLLTTMLEQPVILRPGIFASNALHWWAPQIRNGDVVRWPCAAAETAPIDEHDIARAAARTLIDDRYAGLDCVLTGPESISQAEQVHAIGDAIGRSIRFEELTPEQFLQEAEGVWPPGIANMLLSAWRATLGHRAYITSAVQEITGLPPRTFAQWAASNATAFRRTDGPT
jgi:uncharacterized protein YbjT (DUF2867 family)